MSPRAVLIVAWLGWVFDVMDTALFNFAKKPMLTEMLGEAGYKAGGAAWEGRIQMVFLIGWAIGGLVFGILADRWGRSRTLIVTILLYSALTGLTALAQTPDQVLGLRFLTALGIGGEWAAGAAMVAEAYRSGGRVGAAAWLQTAAAFGPWLAAYANFKIPTGDWRTLFLVGVIPAVMVVFVRFKADRSSSIENRSQPLDPPSTINDSPLLALFATPALRRRALVATTLGIVGVTGAGILPFWLPNLIDGAAVGMAAEVKKNFVSLNTFTLHIGTLLGVLVFPAISERIGRRPAFALFFVMAPLVTSIALVGKPNLDTLLYLLPVVSFFAVGLSAGFVLYFPELFPTHLRATGAGLAYNTGRIVSAPMPALIGMVISNTGGNAAYGVLVASAIYVLGLLALPFAPETRGQALPE
ncbi:MFS transporter [bacterium]|nr:MAG: MFS transporter [bacterium]